MLIVSPETMSAPRRYAVQLRLFRRAELRRAIEPSLRLPEGPDIIEGVEEDRRKGTAPGFPERAPTLGRRTSPRQRVMLTALIVDIEAETVVRCRVENVSESGARLRLPEPRFLPPSFWLIAVTAGLAYRASTVWRDGVVLGISVADELDLNRAMGQIDQRLRSYWMRAR
jgi:hypothetical protein